MRVCDSHLQRRADGDDLVALGGVDLQQHRNRLLQHRTADVVETTPWFVHGDVGDLAVSGGNCTITDTCLLHTCNRHKDHVRAGHVTRSDLW